MISWTRAITLDGHRVDVQLEYTKARADVIDFHFDSQPPATWSISRDLLEDGLVMRAGWGNIRVSPSAEGLGIYLNTRDGEAYVVFHLDHIAGFLSQTYRLVPRGHEYDGLDWGQLLATTGGAA